MEEEQIQKLELAKNNILRGEDIEAATYIVEKCVLDNVILVGGRVNYLKVALRQVLNFVERYQKSDYETICLKNNELEENIDLIQERCNDLLKENKKLKEIKNETKYGTETIHLITAKDMLNINKYLIEIFEGEFIDLKQIYLENEQLKLKMADLYKGTGNYAKANSIMTNKLRDYIPVRKVKEKLIKYQKMYELLLEHQSGKESNRTKYLRGRIHMCQELLEEEKQC